MAHLLHQDHDVTVYEKSPRPGGHTRTLTIDYDGVPIAVDTGFIVFNERNYPHFSSMLRYLGVAAHKSDMSFAATIGGGWLEWGAKDVNAVFGQRRNILRPGFHRLFRDVMRFNAQAEECVARNPHLTVGGLIDALSLGDWFRRYYLLPMAGAIWSCPPSDMLGFPAASFVRFFANHGLLSTSGQPQWFTVTGGAQTYLEKLMAPFASSVRKNCGAARVARHRDTVTVVDTLGGSATYDHVVFACHADEALEVMADPSDAEQGLLSRFQYQRNVAVLHKDTNIMPRRKRCWASWVYHADFNAGSEAKIAVSYWMNRLQGIDARKPLFVTLNAAEKIAPEHIFDRHEFSHPVFDSAAIAAQHDIQALQGTRNTWFCGAHLRNGFHEDGLWSAVNVAARFGIGVPWRERQHAHAPEQIYRPVAVRPALEGIPA